MWTFICIYILMTLSLCLSLNLYDKYPDDDDLIKTHKFIRFNYKVNNRFF